MDKKAMDKQTDQQGSQDVGQQKARDRLEVFNTKISPMFQGRGLEYLNLDRYEDVQKAKKTILCPMCDFNGFHEVTSSIFSQVKLQVINCFTIVHSIGSERILKQRGVSRPWGEPYLGNDYETTKFVRENTTIPVVQNMEYWLSDETQWWLMSKLPGQTLDSVWDLLNSEQQNTVIREIVDYIAQAREFTRPTPQTADGAPIRDTLMGSSNRVEMLTTDKEEWYARITPYLDGESDDWKKYFKDNYPVKPGDKFVLTHGDLNPSNIMVQDSHVTGILDWEHSGFYPEWWEWAYCLRRAQAFSNYGNLLRAELGARFGKFHRQDAFCSNYERPESRERPNRNRNFKFRK
ncbi:kinase subdomain-containing protein [Rutstroemia sp. NJR-2017a BVV2]|nr:kinase subdomain-containing protein [Rutstroemia sp. NJR-2017a BVV2]